MKKYLASLAIVLSCAGFIQAMEPKTPQTPEEIALKILDAPPEELEQSIMKIETKRPPLYDAIERSDIDEVENLLEDEALADKTDEDGNTPLHIAALYGNNEAIKKISKTLGDEKTKSLLSEKNNEGYTPVHIATRMGHPATLKLLLIKAPGLLEAKDSKGKTPLHLALETCRLDVVLELLKLKANVQAQDADNNEPVHLAVFCEEPKILEALLAGLDKEALNTPGEKGDTSLHSAVRSHANSCTYLETLLAKGADPSIKNDEGLSPQELAEKLVEEATIEGEKEYRKKVVICLKAAIEKR